MNGTVETPRSVINSTTWYTYEDTECATMDSFDESIDGRLFSHDVANHTDVATLTGCAELCLAEDTCKSFDFGESTTFCALGSGKVGQFGPMQEVDGFVHHDRLLPGCIPAAARCGLYNVSVDTQPVSMVTIVPNHDHQITISPAQQSIDPREWTIPVTFEICVVDDFKDIGLHSSEIWHTALSDDPYYAGIALHNVTVDSHRYVDRSCWLRVQGDQEKRSILALGRLEAAPRPAVR